MTLSRIFARPVLALAGGVAIASGAWPGPAEAGSQYVIVAVEPASHALPPGRVLDVNDRLDVPEGTVVTLLGEDGSVSAIPGPASVVVTEDAVETTGSDAEEQAEKRSTLAKIAGLLAGERERAESLGGSRVLSAAAEPEGLEDPWTVSIHASGPACIRDGEIVLARESAGDAIPLTVRAEKGAAVSDLVWPAGEAKFKLPAEISTESSAIAVKAGDEAARVALHRLPEEINAQNPVDVIGWMLASGCERQALAYARRLSHEAR